MPGHHAGVAVPRGSSNDDGLYAGTVQYMQNSPQYSQYQALYSQYSWLVPSRFNIAEACCRRWALSGADARRIAIYTEDESGARDIWTYERLFETTNRLSRGLERMGVSRGDRVAVILPQRGETAAAHMAIYQMGAVCVPLSTLFGPEALEQRLRDSGARVAIIDAGSQADRKSAAEGKSVRLVGWLVVHMYW